MKTKKSLQFYHTLQSFSNYLYLHEYTYWYHNAVCYFYIKYVKQYTSHTPMMVLYYVASHPLHQLAATAC